LSTNEFFDQVVECARISAAGGQDQSVDPITLRAYGLEADGLRRFLDAIKPVAQLPEFRQFLEQSYLSAFQELFTVIDGLSAIADKSVDVVDLGGRVISADLHMAFGKYMLDRGLRR